MLIFKENNLAKYIRKMDGELGIKEIICAYTLSAVWNMLKILTINVLADRARHYAPLNIRQMLCKGLKMRHMA